MDERILEAICELYDSIRIGAFTPRLTEIIEGTKEVEGFQVKVDRVMGSKK